jgi:hypothetical protein
VCPRCSANYEKAYRIRTEGRAPGGGVEHPGPAEVAVSFTALDDAEREVADPAFELKLCRLALPMALSLAWAFLLLTPFAQAIVFAMPLHEAGHAVMAWFTGRGALPVPMVTLVAPERGIIWSGALLGALAYLLFLAYRAERWPLVGLGVGLLGLQAVGTLYLDDDTAVAMIYFAGDGVGMVLASLLMACFFVGKDTLLYRAGLRWGFLFMGAAAFTTLFSHWWTLRGNPEALPWLVDHGDVPKVLAFSGWSVQTLANHYVALGVACLCFLLVAYVLGVRRAKRDAEAFVERGNWIRSQSTASQGRRQARH